MNKIELLAPAKDLFKAKIAIRYGADAVYVGGKKYSLRYRASNFSLDDLRELVSFAHHHQSKVYVTVNIVFHDADFLGLREYLKELDDLGVDAIIIESLAVLALVKKMGLKMECHISTQLSTLNSLAVNLLADWGADRVVLARELTIEEIEDINRQANLPLEVFIHGGMCSNYSGRCTLSNRMTRRDANRGGCAQSCRWKYHIYENDKLISDEACPLSLSSKDLRATSYIAKLIKADVASLKIEGRMKSDYYIAQVVKTYRLLIDEIYANGDIDAKRLAYYDQELSKAENRPSDDGFFGGNPDDSKHLYGINGAGVTHDFVAYVLAYDQEHKSAKIEVRNKFNQGDILEILSPDKTKDNCRFKVMAMFNEEYDALETANQPMQIIFLSCPYVLSEGDMLRKVRDLNAD